MVSTRTVTLFLALLALASLAAVATALALSALAAFVPAARRLRTSLRAEIQPFALGFAAVVAGVATTGSLYLSEIAGFPPCVLCWVQRGFMYPLLPLLGLAAARGALRARIVVAGWALAGAGVSTWHLALERFPGLESGVCLVDNPCSIRWVEHFGFVTIPLMAFAAFTLIALLVVLSARPQESP